MPYHWQSNTHHVSTGVEDMVLLSNISDSSIVDNLHKRYNNNCIFTYIGPVLISVNPFRQMPYFTDREIELYQGTNAYENPPHIYALADDMFRNMLIDQENHSVIITGESGSGKTVCAKYIMNYLAKVSGGRQAVQLCRVKHIKDIIIETNPLLEAFGNAKTVRNNNSSRFGKYVEIFFNRSSEPVGGKVSNFLLEKSRVVTQNSEERSFHIFYQICSGIDSENRKYLGVTDPEYYYYLNQSGVSEVSDIDDAEDFKLTMNAMKVIGISETTKMDILKLVAAVMHIGNISFTERNNYAEVANAEFLEYPAFLLDIDTAQIRQKLISRRLESKWGKASDVIDVKLNVEQANYTRDALAKALYSRLFDFLVASVNKALQRKGSDGLTIGVLDIYGFEIFTVNGFEQFCINYVNEKLQQVFIELTLKAEQEEYLQEGIQWTPIDYFNNKVVCELIEGRNPPGIFGILDDTCFQMHGQSEGTDLAFLRNLNQHVNNHDHYQASGDGFAVRHYAGVVSYSVDGFCDKNRDPMFLDLVELMQSSKNKFFVDLFPENVQNAIKTRPTTLGNKIKLQANELLGSLMRCYPHYIRCITPNDNKRSADWNEQRVRHQVEYLGLKENVRVRRAGYAYRRSFEKFLQRYGILIPGRRQKRNQDIRKSLLEVLAVVNMDQDQFQLGRSKIFIKTPESLFLLEEVRERKYDGYARVIQKAYRTYFARKNLNDLRKQAADLLGNRKQRRRFSINRQFYADYLGMDQRPTLRALIGKKERVVFACVVKKYDRFLRPADRELLLTSTGLFIVGKGKVKNKTGRGTVIADVIKRYITFQNLTRVGLSPFQDDFMILFVRDDSATVFECVFKTELLLTFCKQYSRATGRDLNLAFADSFDYPVKQLVSFMGSAARTIRFVCNQDGDDQTLLTKQKNALIVSVGPGLSNQSEPGERIYDRSPDVLREASRKHMQQIQRMSDGNAGKKVAVAKKPVLLPKGPGVKVKRKAPQVPNTSSNKGDDFRSQLECQIGKFRTAPAKDKGTTVNGMIASVTAKRPPPPPRPGLPPKPVPRCRMLYDYEAQHDDELSFLAGDVIELKEKNESGWWNGCLAGKEGLFPSNYAEMI